MSILFLRLFVGQSLEYLYAVVRVLRAQYHQVIYSSFHFAILGRIMNSIIPVFYIPYSFSALNACALVWHEKSFPGLISVLVRSATCYLPVSSHQSLVTVTSPLLIFSGV
jgi:hypothetical protein